MSLESEIRQVLAEMEVWLSYGSCTSWAPNTSAGEKTYGRPPGEAMPPHVEYRAAWLEIAVAEQKWSGENEGVDTERFGRLREVLLAEAQQHLASLLKQKPTPFKEETLAEREERVVREGEGWSVTDTARHCRCTETFVRKARARVATAAIVDKADQIAKARELASEGLTERQIEMITKLPKTSLRRLIGRAA